MDRHTALPQQGRSAMCCCHSPIHSWLLSKHYIPSASVLPSSLSSMYGIATLQLTDYHKRKEDLFFSSLAISFRCSAVKFKIHAWFLSSLFCNFFSMKCLLSSFPFAFSAYPSFLSPQNICLAGVVTLGGNGFSGYQDRGK